jgi:hypothetical protein
MKPSEFYEKYWTVNGRPTTPLTDSEKKHLDELCDSPVNAFRMEFARKRSGEIIDINIENLIRDFNKLPSFLKKDQ